MRKRRTHGQSYGRTYNIWAMMRQRCTNPKAANYINYGGAGVRCCERWRRFEHFFEDMGYPPTPEHTLDRIDTTGHYEPGNCRWADKYEQQGNKRNAYKIAAFGETKTLAQWARDTGIKRHTIKHRLENMGMSPEQALTTQRMSWVMRRVRCRTLDGGPGWEFGSLAEAAREMGVVKGSLWAALKRSPLVEHVGYFWEYVD